MKKYLNSKISQFKTFKPPEILVNIPFLCFPLDKKMIREFLCPSLFSTREISSYFFYLDLYLVVTAKVNFLSIDWESRNHYIVLSK